MCFVQIAKEVVCVWDCCASFDETALSVFFVLPFFSFFPTFFSSLRLANCEMPNDLKKTRRLFDESAPDLRKSCPFLPECSALFGGYARTRKKNEALSAPTCDECEEKLLKTPIRISLRGDKCVSLSSYSDTPL